MSSFIQRFKMLCPQTWPNPQEGGNAAAVRLILQSISVPESEYRLGKTKVFIRAPNTINELEEKRNAWKPILATKIRAFWIGRRVRKAYLKRQRQTLQIQKHFRRFQKQKQYKKLKKAALVVSKNRKMKIARKSFLLVIAKTPRRAVLLIQRAFRAHHARLYLARLSKCAQTTENWRKVNWGKPLRSKLSVEPRILDFVKVHSIILLMYTGDIPKGNGKKVSERIAQR